jgi:alpha-ribazole phosphatase/probable phosphoglycerate mutase
MQTADVLVSCLALPEPLIPVNGLVEVGIGGREGDTDGPIHDETAEVLRTWVVHGGLEARAADGENGHQVVARVTTALRTIAAENQGEVVALVGHVASLTAGLSALCGIGEEIWGRPLQPAVPFRVLTDGLAWRCLEWPG